MLVKDSDNLYFVVFKGSFGKETYLVDEKNLDKIEKDWADQKDLKFLYYNPENLKDERVHFKRFNTVASLTVHQEQSP